MPGGSLTSTAFTQGSQLSLLPISAGPAALSPS
jgi:hypothetical protein